MAARQPFTALCRATASSRFAGRADLHIHTTHSDGSYSPGQIVDLARRSGLAAVSITDHDTLGGIAEARAAAGSQVEIVSGVEISAEHHGKELHLLGYFVRPDDADLTSVLARLSWCRVERFQEMVRRLKGCGVCLDEEDLPAIEPTGSLGRRHLAALLVKTRRAGSVRQAFIRYLGDGGRVAVPKTRLPVGQAIALVRGAGGVASWAHPSYDCTEATVNELRTLGLGALEATYPGFRSGRERLLRTLAAACGLAVTGGSDCHDPDHAGRSVGASSITTDELETLRRLASR